MSVLLQMLKILTWNVLAQQWIDLELKDAALDKRHLKRTYRIEKQLQYIKQTNPDVILLQETTPIVLRQYQRQLPDYEIDCFSQMRWQKEYSPINGNAILWKKNILKDTRCDTIILDKQAGIYGTLLRARVTNGAQITFVNVHLSYGNFKAASNQFKTIFDYLERSDQKIVIGGDFNMGYPDWEIERFFNGKGFTDCLKRNTVTHPFKNDPYGQTIEHILIKNMKCQNISIGESKSIGDSLKKYGTDHYPIVVEIKIS